jgi:hypothetical protein
MKTIFKMLGAATALALAVPQAAIAQNEPLMAAEIYAITVASGTGSVVGATVISGGSGYTVAPKVTIAGGGGTGATARAVLTGGAVSGVFITAGGSNYTSLPLITIDPPGTKATASASFTGPGPGPLTGITLGDRGSGYTTAPTVTITGGGATTQATASTTIQNGEVIGITMLTAGSGYTSAPTVEIAAPGNTATAAPQELGAVFMPANEAYGPVGTRINIWAEGRGTFPLGGYTYSFFVNGAPLMTSTVPQPPGGGPGAVSWAPPQPGSYLITALVSDGAHSVTTLAVRYHAVGTAIIGPVENTLVPNGSSVVIQATATPMPSVPYAFVERMEFYVDNALVGTDTNYPYSFIYTPSPSPSEHSVEVRGFDNHGRQIPGAGSAMATRKLFMVSPIGIPPIVRITNPSTDASVQSGLEVNIIADVSAPTGFIKNVDFFINGVLHSSTQTFPFTAKWTPQVPGRYQFVAIGYDDKSNAVASTPIVLTATGAFPTVAITEPDRSGFTVVQGATLPVTVSAAGPDGGLASLKTIEFLVDGVVNDSLPKAATPVEGETPTAPVLTAPFIFNWKSNVSVGTHRLSARVTSNSNLSITSSEITVNVIANQAPAVAITAPTTSTSGTVNVPTMIVAAPTDIDGTIANVEFFVNGTRIGAAASSPFQFEWTPTNAGTFLLTAKATDNGGKSTTSEAVSVTVDPQAPSGPAQSTVSATVFRGDYGTTTEAGRFTMAINRNNRATFIAYSISPAGRTYFWTDIVLNTDGTFQVRDASNQVVLTGQTSATGVSGTFGGKTFIGPITASNGAFTPLLVTGTVAGVPNSQIVAIVGGDSSITIYSASGTNREIGSDFLGATGIYSFASATGGRYSGTVANSVSLVSGSVSGSINGTFLLRQQASRISNISTRALAGSGENTLVAGFVISGTGSKPLLVRAVGPTLVNFGVANALSDPNLNVLSRTSVSLASNNDWAGSAALAALFSQVGAFPLATSTRDAAVQTSLAPGTYTAVVGGAGTAPGSALIEIYDADQSNPVTSRITNISTRGQVGAGDALIAGFVITGDVRKKLLIRAVGPTLTAFGLTGVLSDPKIEVLGGSVVIASNNDWTESSGVALVTATSSAVGAFPLSANSKDAATVLQLSPGSYTVQISGAGSSTGTVLVEIYDADL